MRHALALAALLGAAALDAAEPGAVPAGNEVLERRCLQCHGATQKMGELDLSSREGALAGGTRGPALDPADPPASLLLARANADEMPPGAPLSGADKEMLRGWIAAGAPWPGTLAERRAGPDWWSLQPVGRAAPPEAEAAPPEWRGSPIDRWVFSALDEAGLRPAPEAGRRDLIRRLTFSLTGLPPEPEEVSAFLADPSPGAYERLVDRLLASPRYGERWARHWLDLVRFAESEGFERDLPRDHAWPYRDYVIRSFNDDKPYLRFAREQIAGDVIEPATRDGVVATAMLTLGPVDAVGLTSAIPEERRMIREDHLEEMLGTVTQTFLGLTVNCARCHDHKFDPITQEEYYRMKAAFEAVWPPTRPVPEAGLDALFPHGRALLTRAEESARQARVSDVERRIEGIEAELGGLYRDVRPRGPRGEARRPFARWTFDSDGRADHSPLHLRLVRAARIAGGALGLDPAGDGREDAGAGDQDSPASSTAYGVSRKLAADIRAKTLEVWLDVRSAPEKSATVMEIRGLSGYRGASVDGIHYVAGDRPRWENSSVGRFRSKDTGGTAGELAPGDRVHVAVSYADDGTIAVFRNGAPHGKPYKPDAGIPAGRLQTYRAGDALVRFPASRHLHVAEARLYDAALSADEVAASYRAGILDLAPPDLRNRMTPGQLDRIATLEQERRELRDKIEAMPEPQLVHGAAIRASGPTHVLIRGAVDRPGKVVSPGGLACVGGLPAEFGLAEGATEGDRRRAMAEWVANEANPLFSRVAANRLWQGHFGRGFVANPSDFGYNGGRPSHPGLLDWLASELVRSGWSLKTLHKRILMSRTYRQASSFREAAAMEDADNRLLWRFPARRLDGEEVRDAMLAASGDLNREMHGPSFRPFRFGEARGSLRSYILTDDDSPDLRRRTVYRMNIITGGDPMLEALDCPLPSTKTPRRRSTTTALQALSLMNNAFVQRRARGLAARLQGEAGGLDSQVRRAFELALGRPPARRELADSRSLADRRGLDALCWGLFNTSEFLHVR